eukprot:366410-Chlamydomonas_euryale.AAC.15
MDACWTVLDRAGPCWTVLDRRQDAGAHCRITSLWIQGQTTGRGSHCLTEPLWLARSKAGMTCIAKGWYSPKISAVSNGAAGCGALWMRHMPAASALSSPDVASRWLGTAHHAQGVMRRTMPPGGRPTNGAGLALSDEAKLEAEIVQLPQAVYLPRPGVY